MSLVQIILVVIVAFIIGCSSVNDQIETYQPVVACSLIGLVTGHLELGVMLGGSLQLITMGWANVGAAMLLADYVTNEENETLRFQQRAQGPSNTNALAAASSPALTAVVAQSEYANLQRVGGNYWASAETLGQICVNGNPDGKDSQTLIEDAVAGITAPVTQ